MVTEIKTVFTQVEEVSLIISKIIEGELSGDGEESDLNQVTAISMIIISKASENNFDEDYQNAVTFILSVTKIKAFITWSQTEKDTFKDIKVLLSMLAVTFSGTLSDSSQGLIASKGLVVAVIDTTVSIY